MKRIITLLIAAGAFVTVQAQTSREEARKVILGGGNGSGNGGSNSGRDVILGGGNNGESYPSYPNSYPSSSDRQSQIDQVNREYDNKIQSIRNNTYLSYEEKQRAIRQLEKDRQARIRQINSNYEKNRRYDDDDRYEGRKDNGKHKGWEKGKGNPHKSGGKDWKKGKKN